jgi:hypothetical protein
MRLSDRFAVIPQQAGVLPGQGLQRHLEFLPAGLGHQSQA